MFFFRLDIDAFNISFCRTEAGITEAIVALDALIAFAEEQDDEAKELKKLRKHLFELKLNGYQ